MDLANLIYFVIFSAVGFVLFIGACKYPANIGARNHYLPVSLALFSVATCLLGLMPWMPSWAIGLVNLCLLGASLSQALLYRAWRVDRSKKVEAALWLSLMGLALAFAVLNDPQYFKSRVAVFTAIGFALFFWKTYELLANQDHRARMLFVFIIVLMTLASLMGLARFWAIYRDIGGASQSLQSESVMAMAMKWGYYTIFLLNYIVIFSYYLQVSRGKEAEALKELESQQETYHLLEQKKQAAEKLNQELRAVLAEKTNLLKAVTNESKATAMGVLASSIAHEINNPLCAASLNLEIAGQVLASMDNASEAENLIRDAHMDCLRIQEVIDKLRKLFTRGSSEFSQINLHELVQETCVFFERELTSKGIDVQMDFAQTDLMVSGDRGQLQMVMINLLANAVQALSNISGQKLLRISLIRNGTYVELSFEDNGCGIPEDQLAQIFEAHYSSKVQGMGMGLWLVKTIVENHDGSICAMNSDHGGARFNLSLLVS
jgi:signal transduction histidine kinase